MFRLKKIIPLSLVIFLAILSLSFATKNVKAQSAGCTSNPNWTLDHIEDGASSVTYHLFLKNNCAGTKNFNLKVTQLPTSPHNFPGWGWKFANGTQDTMYVKSVAGGSKAAVALTVSRPTNVSIPEGNYTPLTLRAALASDTTVNDTISLVYIVQNPTTPAPTSGPTCVRDGATFNVTPTDVTGAAGEEQQFTLKVTNKDSTDCSPSTFNLSANLSDLGWDLVLGDDSLSIDPGANKTTILYVTSPDDATNGPTTISVNAQRTDDALITQNVIYNVVNPVVSQAPTDSPTQAPSQAPTAAPTTTPGTTSLNLSVGIDGIGTTTKFPIGSNKNPLDLNRNLTVRLFNAATNTPADVFPNWTLTYNPNTQKFEGKLDFDNSFQSGIYNIYLEGPQVLLGQIPGSVILTKGQTKSAPNVDLVTGDIDKLDQSNNSLDLNDYNILLSCSIYSQDRSACDLNPNYPKYSDLDDNGIVNLDDLTLWVQEIDHQNGATLPH